MTDRETERRKNISDFLSDLPMCNSSFLSNFVPSRQGLPGERSPGKHFYKDITVDNSRSVELQFEPPDSWKQAVVEELQRMKRREEALELEPNRCLPLEDFYI